MSVKICNGTIIRPHPGITHSEERCPLCDERVRAGVWFDEATRIARRNSELCDEIFELKRKGAES